MDFDKVYEEKEETAGVTLSKLADYLYGFGNDIRILHLYTSGLEFLPYHEKLNELYDVLFDAYDTVAEMAISHNESIKNPSKIEGWEVLEGKDFSAEEICNIVIEKGNELLNYIKNTNEYESFVQSNIDEFYGELDKIINYIFKQSNK